MRIKLPDQIIAYNDLIEIRLTTMEANLLELLIKNQGIVMTHVEIAIELWGETNPRVAPEMTRPLCSRLRKKIGQEKIATLHGRGYIYL